MSIVSFAKTSLSQISCSCSLLPAPAKSTTPTQDGLGRTLSDSEEDDPLDLSLSSATLTSIATASQLPCAMPADSQTGSAPRRSHRLTSTSSAGAPGGQTKRPSQYEGGGSDQTSLTTTSELDFRKDLQALDADIARLQLQFTVARHGRQTQN